MKQANYSYQKGLVSRVLTSFKTHAKVVLAACPGAGKTRMAITVADRYIKSHPNAKILILTHGQILIRDQWDQNFSKFEHDLKHDVITTMQGSQWHKSKVVNAKRIDRSSVLVSLPQTLIGLLDLFKSVDLVIIDEAHHFYFGKQVETILKRLKPKHQLLLTGTPSQFLDDPDFKILGITIQELLEYSVLTDPLIELVKSNYNLSIKDYNAEMQVRQSVKLSKSATDSTLGLVLDKLISRLSSEERTSPEEYSWAGNPSWESVLEKLHKTMIVCHTQAQAQDVFQYMALRGVKAQISVSDINEGVEELEDFKHNPECKLFIVVNRGVLGFDYPELTNLIDLSGTLNVNRLFQMLCRVVRKNHQDPSQRKLFIKASNVELAHLNYFVMSFVVSLSDPKYYFSYKGNPNDFKPPIPDDKIFKRPGKVSGNKVEAPFPDLPELFTFNEIKKISQGEMKSVAYTDFKTVKQRLFSNNEYHLEDMLPILQKFKSRQEFIKKERNVYAWFLRRHPKLLNETLPSLRVSDSYTLGGILEIAKKYSSKSQFREAHHGKFKWLRKNGHLDKLPFKCQAYTKWDFKKALKVAGQYSKRKDLERASYGCYAFLKRRGLLDKIFGPGTPRMEWSKEKALAVARKCSTKNQFRHNYPGAYKFILTNSLMSEVDKFYQTRRDFLPIAQEGVRRDNSA